MSENNNTQETESSNTPVIGTARKVYREAGTHLVMLKGKRFRPGDKVTAFEGQNQLFVTLPTGKSISEADHVAVSRLASPDIQEKWTLFTDEERASMKRPRSPNKNVIVAKVTANGEVESHSINNDIND